MWHLAFLAVLGPVAGTGALPSEHLAIALRVAGDGRPLCRRYLPDGGELPCLPHFSVSEDQTVNGEARGERIAFTRGAVERLTRDEFALLAGHELAHWYLGHSGSSAANERAADWLGAELACQAGFDVAAGASVFGYLNADRHHPASDKRRAIVLGVRC